MKANAPQALMAVESSTSGPRSLRGAAAFQRDLVQAGARSGVTMAHEQGRAGHREVAGDMADSCVHETLPREAPQHAPTLRADSKDLALLAQLLPGQFARLNQLFDTKLPDLKAPGERALAVAPATTDAVTTRAKPQLETLRLTVPPRSHGENRRTLEPERPTEDKKRSREEVQPVAQQQPAALRQELSEVAPAASQPMQVPVAFEPLLGQIAEDPSLRVALTGASARLSIDTGDAGRVNVQLRVNDGIAEVRATGPGAALLDHRQHELRVAFAQEGLAMGQFDLTQSGGQQRHERPEQIERDTWKPRASTAAGETANSNGHLHVKA